MVSEEKILKILKETLSEKRLSHTLNVAKCAIVLAERFGADKEKAYIAALLHDITKEEPLENQLKICEKYDIMLDELFLSSPQLIHPVTASCIARELGADEEICKAVYEHTLGSANMTVLSKCVWLADLIEPSRKFPGVDNLRTLAGEDLNLAVIAGMDRTIKYLEEAGEVVHPGLKIARDALLEAKN